MDYEVVVVGGGAAGLCAAGESARRGARVLLAEAASEAGGALALAGGSVMAAGTSVQCEAGYDDHAEVFFDYFMTFNQWRLEPSLARAFCAGSGATIEWLRQIGVRFPPEGIFRSGLEAVPRTHRADGGGAAIAAALAAALPAGQVDVALGNRVDHLAREPDGSYVVGSRGDYVRARAVVVASGGFAANLDLVRRYFPDACLAADWLFSPSPPTCVGDGLRLAMDLGAGTAGVNQGEINLTPGFTSQLEPLRPGWLLYVDRCGRRFVDETAPTAVMRGLLRDRGGRCWALLDERARSRAAGPPVLTWGRGSWTADVLAEQIASGRVQSARSLAGLARLIDVPAASLQVTVAEYNRDCHAGADTRFFKPASALAPMEEPPYFAVEVRAAVVVASGFGVRVDAQTRVLNSAGCVIPGLFAAGEVAGNIYGEQHLGSGMCLGSALTFGRIAGQQAAAIAAGKTCASHGNGASNELEP